MFTFTEMKLIPFVFSLMIFAVSLAPCSDDCLTSNDHKTESHANNRDHTHDDDLPEDTCSPLCTCHCCHTNTVVLQKMKLSNISSPVNPIIELVTSKPRQHNFSIWHPPKA